MRGSRHRHVATMLNGVASSGPRAEHCPGWLAGALLVQAGFNEFLMRCEIGPEDPYSRQYAGRDKQRVR
jgi:hypothetical protein